MTWIGDAIGAVGGLIGGRADRGASASLNKSTRKWQTRENKKAYRRNKKSTKWLNKNQIGWTVDAAKRAGIHPLAAMGAPAAASFAGASPSSIPGQSDGGGRSQDYSKAGDAIGSFINRKDAAENRQIQVENARLQNQEIQSRINLNNMQAASMATADNAGPRLIPKTNPKVPLYASFGFYKNGKWEHTHYGPNPEAFEIGVTELGVGGAMHSTLATGTAAANAAARLPAWMRAELAELNARGGNITVKSNVPRLTNPNVPEGSFAFPNP